MPAYRDLTENKEYWGCIKAPPVFFSYVALDKPSELAAIFRTYLARNGV